MDTFEEFLNIIFDFYYDLQGKIMCTVGGVPISLFGFLISCIVIPPVLTAIIPWYDDDDDD